MKNKLDLLLGALQSLKGGLTSESLWKLLAWLSNAILSICYYLIKTSVAECAGDSDSGSANVKEELSALQQTEERQISQTLRARKVDLPEGMTPHELRKSLEEADGIYPNAPRAVGKQFELIQNLEKEESLTKTPQIDSNADKQTPPLEPTPTTNLLFNEIRVYEGHSQDGSGGGHPKKDSSCLEKGDKVNNGQSLGVRKREPP